MADTNDDCLSINSDFERVPHTPLEREEENDLDGRQKTPNGFVASEFEDQSKKPSSIDPSVVAALMKKVDILVVKVDALSQENSELRTQLADFSELRTQLAEFKHHKEHENAKFVIVDNSKGAQWDTSASFLAVTNFTVENGNENCASIRSTRAFSTVPAVTDCLIYNVNYYEVSIDAMPMSFPGAIHVGLASEDSCMEDAFVGGFRHSFAIDTGGNYWESGKMESGFGPGGLSVGDTTGCGIMVGSKTALAQAMDCGRCLEEPNWLFFTKNGKILGTPIALPSDVPSTLFPTVSFCVDKGCKVTANFGNKPFKYVPSAEGLSWEGSPVYCELNKELEKIRVQQKSDQNEMKKTANKDLADLRAQMAAQKADFQAKLDAMQKKYCPAEGWLGSSWPCGNCCYCKRL